MDSYPSPTIVSINSFYIVLFLMEILMSIICQGIQNSLETYFRVIEKRLFLANNILVFFGWYIDGNSLNSIN